MSSPDQAAPTPRRSRGSLTSEAIVDAAIAIVEAEGLDALAMRSLARALNVPVTSVHWHFRTRDDLIDVIAARMANDFYDNVPAVSTTREWQQELRGYLRTLRQQLLQKGSFVELSFDRVGSVMKQPEIRRRMTERIEAEVAILVRAGLKPEPARRRWDICSTYVRGFVLVELAYARATRPISPQDQLYLDPETFPVMSQIADPSSVSDRDADGQFELGLDLLISAIQLELAAPGTPV